MPLKGISDQSSCLKALRVIVGWSRLHTSERIGVPEATLRRWEADDNAPAAYAKWIERMAQLALRNPPPRLPERHRFGRVAGEEKSERLRNPIDEPSVVAYGSSYRQT